MAGGGAGRGGVGFYFALPWEPWAPFGASWLDLGALFLAAAAVFSGRNRPAVSLPAAGCLAVILGFTAAHGHALAVVAPVLERPLGPVTVTGQVVDVEDTRNGRRVTLEDLSIERLSPDQTPYRIRLRMAGYRVPSPPLGDRITLRAKLLPPPEPAASGAYDFTRQAWFQRLGAVGFTLSP